MHRLRSAALLCLLALPGRAHDFWIEPSRYRPAPGSALLLRLRVGQDFKGDPLPRNGSLIRRFALLGPGNEKPIEGREGVDPAGFAKVDGPGLYLAVYDSAFSHVELEAPKFETYLKEEGLEAIAAERLKRGEADRPDYERFARCAKAFIQVGEGPAKGFDRVLGLPLELVPEQDPLAAKRLSVRLLFQGKPLRGAMVVAMNQADPAAKQRVCTDARGRATLRLGKGTWLVKAVHMQRAAKGPDVSEDWESWWASMSFERADA